MGAERARRWKLLPFRSLSLPPPAASKPKNRPPGVTVPPAPATKEKGEEEEVPADFLCCPILCTPMADPVILPSGRTYERACVLACAELGLSLGPDGVVAGGGVAAAIPNDALRAAVRTWCARSGRAAPVAPSGEEARVAVLRAVAAGTQPPTRSSSNLSCSSEGVPVPARSASNLSCSSEGASAASTSSSSSGRSSREMAPVEVQVVVRGKEAAKVEQDEPVRVADAEEEVVAKAVEAGDETEVETAMAALRRATREGAARRRALCGPRLLAALRRVLLSSRHTASARADAAAALANLSLEPENRVPVVRAGAVPALVEVIASAASPPEAREHAAGALFGLALHEGNRAAIGVLGALPPLLAALADRDHAAPRARRDAGMALYHLSFAAVNQSKLARSPGASRTLLSVACDAAEPVPIRRLALMVLCNVAACVEGSAALMDAGAVATASAILSEGACDAELQECCVEALYAMSKGSPRFRGLARAAGADRSLMFIAEQASPGVDKEVVQTVLRKMGRDSSDDDHTSVCRNDEGHHGRSSLPHRRRVASWSAPPVATPPSSHQWRSVCID
ncbi:U-box domain-containing protein 39-like [Miscanthus floridulus]|uniref:U-box domain-containing protein 39-like n=1 Tax=Miscanthus floridulus TaxID=154761 RepID=UPI0034581A3C